MCIGHKRFYQSKPTGANPLRGAILARTAQTRTGAAGRPHTALPPVGGRGSAGHAAYDQDPEEDQEREDEKNHFDFLSIEFQFRNLNWGPFRGPDSIGFVSLSGRT